MSARKVYALAWSVACSAGLGVSGVGAEIAQAEELEPVGRLGGGHRRARRDCAAVCAAAGAGEITVLQNIAKNLRFFHFPIDIFLALCYHEEDN